MSEKITLGYRPPTTEAKDGPVKFAAYDVKLSPQRQTCAWVLPSLLYGLCISFCIALVTIFFICQPVRVEGDSMLPELKSNDRLFINRIAYRIGPIQRGDVVVLLHPENRNKSLIKRVIAGPGDNVLIDHGAVYVNGRRLVEEYVSDGYSNHDSVPKIFVPDHEYFVMGDHRSASTDSRRFGPVSQNLIYGKAVFVYWPAGRAGIVR